MMDIAFIKPEQFPLDEILDDSERLARGWMTVELRDRDGELVPVDDIKKTLNIWMDRGAPISDMHTNRIVGKGLRWIEATHPETGTKGILIDYKIHRHYVRDDIVWDEIKRGKRQGLSIGAQATEKASYEYSAEGEQTKRLAGLEVFEVASVDKPANQAGHNIAVNYLAKGSRDDDQEKLTTDLQKGYAAMDVAKPFAGFSSFDDCVAAQTERGHTGESAQRICGWLMHTTEKKFLEGTNKEHKEDSLNSQSHGCVTKATDTEAAMATPDENSPKERGDQGAPAYIEKVDKLEQRFNDLEASMTTKMDAILKAVKKADEEEKKPEDEAEKKKAADEEEEAKKSGGQTPGEKVQLPKAPVGEIEPQGAPSGDAIALIEKRARDVAAEEVQKALKAAGVTKATTPRPNAAEDVQKGAKEQDDAMELIQKSKKGIVDINTINDVITKGRDGAAIQQRKRVENVLADFRAGKVA